MEKEEEQFTDIIKQLKHQLQQEKIAVNEFKKDVGSRNCR